ncbi:MAG TPA: hypothetical protein H9698_00360 [Candidatus Ruthenibacterium merdavium]|uniref:Lipoprotein n=1 Tax=Candidatus Ruthenibacterium merdavium TaxID=2838752 RepID=A0A9D2Q2N2_9FIRM|nr:hypothetical protein [Candidatus Ruthenibacterium merdavium]
MKTPNKWVSLLLVVCFVAVFTGCQGRAGFGESASNPSLAQTAAQEPLGVSDMKLLTKWNGVCSGAAGEQGFYYPKVKDDGSMLMMYLDYATGTETVLCANLSCEHRDDSCPAWISAHQGGVVPLVVGDSLFLISRGSDNPSEEICQPKIIRMGLNGADKTTVIELDASEELIPPFAGNEDTIVCAYRSSRTDGASLDSDNWIAAIQTKNGRITKLADISENTTTVVGALGEQLLLQSVSGDSFFLSALDVNTAEQKVLDTWRYGEKVLFTTHEGYGFVYADGHIEYSKAPSFEKQEFPGVSMPLDEQIGLEAVTFVDSFDDKVIFEVFHPGDVPAQTQVKEWGLNLSDGTLRELTLCTDFDGVTAPVEIISVLENQLLVVAQLSYQQVSMLDENQMPMQMQTIANQYALITKEDYWNSKANYQLFESVWF